MRMDKEPLVAPMAKDDEQGVVATAKE